MAIDSSLFSADVPAGSYTAGDVIQLKCIAGPKNVRSGRGNAFLKRILTARLTDALPIWEIHVKNSDWIDEAISFAGQLSNIASLSKESGIIQSGCDNLLSPNSSWEVYAVCTFDHTSSSAETLFSLIDIDYPSVSAIQDPMQLQGIPTTITYRMLDVPVYAPGATAGANWTSESVDYLKAGFAYCLQCVEMVAYGADYGGFIAFANAAGMGGLQRIIPMGPSMNSIRYAVGYSSKLVKGPMDVRLMLFHATAGTAKVVTHHDYVKKAIA